MAITSNQESKRLYVNHVHKNAQCVSDANVGTTIHEETVSGRDAPDKALVIEAINPRLAADAGNARQSKRVGLGILNKAI
jgi:hypothetical protein